MPRPIDLSSFHDKRGWLTVYDPANQDLPFIPKRVFWIWGVPKGAERANHSHETCSQIIIPIYGNFIIEINNEKRYYLKGHSGLLVEPGHKIRLYGFSENAIALVLCDEEYNRERIKE